MITAMTTMKATVGHNRGLGAEDHRTYGPLAESAGNKMKTDSASTTARRGSDAVAHAWAMFEAAGLDTATLVNAIGGRPRIDSGAARSTHLPILNFRVPEEVHQALTDQASSRGLTTNALAR